MDYSPTSPPIVGIRGTKARIGPLDLGDRTVMGESPDEFVGVSQIPQDQRAAAPGHDADAVPERREDLQEREEQQRNDDEAEQPDREEGGEKNQAEDGE